MSSLKFNYFAYFFVIFSPTSILLLRTMSEKKEFPKSDDRKWVKMAAENRGNTISCNSEIRSPIYMGPTSFWRGIQDLSAYQIWCRYSYGKALKRANKIHQLCSMHFSLCANYQNFRRSYLRGLCTDLDDFFSICWELQGASNGTKFDPLWLSVDFFIFRIFC